MARFDDEAKRRAENERRRRLINDPIPLPDAKQFTSALNDLSEKISTMGYTFAYSEFRSQYPKEFYEQNPFDGYNLTDKHPRTGFIDGGIILKSSFTVTHDMMTQESAEEWNAISDFIDGMANLVANEILPERMYHIWDAVPVITTMEK